MLTILKLSITFLVVTLIATVQVQDNLKHKTENISIERAEDISIDTV